MTELEDSQNLKIIPMTSEKAEVSLPPAVITGVRVEIAEKGITFDDDGTAVILAGSTVGRSFETL